MSFVGARGSCWWVPRGPFETIVALPHKRRLRRLRVVRMSERENIMSREIGTTAAALLLAALAMPALGQATGEATQSPPAERPALPMNETQREQLRAPHLLPLSPHVRDFRVTEGAHEGRTLQQRLVQGQSRGQWELELEGYNRLYLQRGASGDLMLSRIDLIDQHMAVVYDPAVTFIPAEVPASVSLVERANVTVYDLQTGEQTRTGTATHEIESISRTNFNTPVGVLGGFLEVVEHRIDTALANVSMDMEIGYVENQGIVARRIRFTTEKIGLFGDTTTRTVKIAETLPRPSAGDAPPAGAQQAAPAR